MQNGRMLDAAGVEVPVRYKAGTVDTLVILLHGAVDRDKRKVPFLQPFYPNLSEVHQLSVSDPGMMRFSDLAATWYLGWEGRRLWEDLGRAIRDFAASISCASRVYVGGSSGGFAALLLSYADPRSVAIAANPQTNLLKHVYRRHITNLLSVAWPTAKTAEALKEAAPFDLGAVYGSGFENRFVYLQSAGDFLHLYQQALPFLSALPKGSEMSAVVNIDYHGLQGHGASMPYSIVGRWVQAVLDVQDTADQWSQSVLDAQYRIQATSAETSKQARNDQSGSTGFASADLQMADILARQTLDE